ncbi:CRISPR-associated protein Cas5 [Blautia schinkii]|nr:CRISPR-associated protein Cas5 [Blautia schinkii]
MTYTEKRYEWSFEVQGKFAYFGRSDCGSAGVSYPAPTRSALLGMMTGICFSKNAYFWPERVEICRPIVFSKYKTNYNGPLRKSSNAPFQCMMTVLENVDYKVYGVVKGFEQTMDKVNPVHQLRDIFERRLKNGLFFRMPCLGITEFTPDYFGPVKDDTYVDESINLVIPSMLDTMFDSPIGGRVAPKFIQDVRIEKGVLHYAE